MFLSHRTRSRLRVAALAACVTAAAAPGSAQVTPAAGYTPPDDTPSIRVGATIFADYTIQQQPQITDADGNRVTLNQFQIGRSYLNVTGSISHRIAFRLTPDIARETGAGSSLNGSYTFRLKYAYAQWNLDDYMTRGSFARFGMQQNPYFDFFESVYRYRFQGTIFTEREGYQSSADVGAAFRYSLPGSYGDVQTGFFNGENYNRAEVNDQKAFMIRGTVRPLPRHALLRGLRFTGFLNKDAYVRNADRTRALVAASYEHPSVSGAFEYQTTTDQPSTTRTAVKGRGWSVFVNPRHPSGWEGLLRFDHNVPDTTLDRQVRERTIAGVAYWFPHQGSVATALMLDVDNATFDGFSTAQPTQRRFALHAYVGF
ncbi:MAG TPA: hypothetical protein VFK57_00965 [Vicinamibacterales bacterium]|nr:hypothetical protein [Vicinamibacterales bacterium]